MSRARSALREGFTTGTAAAGAALAALDFLCRGSAPHEIAVPLPPFASTPDEPAAFAGRSPRLRLTLPVEMCAAGPAAESPPEMLAALAAVNPAFAVAHASIRKDGGDDPDATSGALITATVCFRPGPVLCPEDPDFVRIEGGFGVGRVTLPGLPVPVGAAAVNPVPQEQIRAALGEYAAERMRKLPAAQPCPPLTVIISVPQGKEIARRTFNPRLGIVDGISILGTHGTVRPFSHEAWQAAVAQELQVALACGCRTVCLSTGRRSEKLLADRYPELTPQSFIQAADFAYFSLHAAGNLPFEHLVWGCFFGKLVKLAQGHTYTHARDAQLDMAALAALCREHGARCASAVAGCITAAHALELLLEDPAGPAVTAALTAQAARVAHKFAGRPVRLYLFHTDGRELYTL